MAKLHAKARNALKSSQFALPKRREYPIEDASHAVDAKSRAVQQYEAGHISKQIEAKILAAANRKLHGGKK